MDFKFPNRRKDIDETRELLNELIESNITFGDIIVGLKLTQPYLGTIEKEIFGDELNNIGNDGWAQVGIVRKVLDLTSESYYQTRFYGENRFGKQLKQEVDKWKSKITKPNK